MKKILTLFTTWILLLALTACNGGKGADLLILSWGEYISEDAIANFEEANNVSVRVVSTDSNESMYTMIQNRTSEYDIAIPSDYMIHQLMEDDMIHRLDYDKLLSYEEGMFVPELEALMKGEDCISYEGYYMPYFWGSLGIMYSNKKIPNMSDIVRRHGFHLFYDKGLQPKNLRIAMYNGSRDALASAELHLGYSLNTKDHDKITECMELIKAMGFTTWGTDDLKIQISMGNLDAALVYTGDYFDAYYADIEGGNEDNTKTYGIYAPEEHNNIFLDAMVIPKTTSNLDLAHKFIDYMISYEGALLNADYVGYCPTVNSVYKEIMSNKAYVGVSSNPSYSPVNILKHEGSRGEVYQFLGADTFRHIEREYTKVLF